MSTLNLLEQQQTEVGRTLVLGVLRGYWTLEQLDHVSGHWALNERERAVSNARRTSTKRYAAWYGPGEPYRNLARDWINSHSAEFDKLLQHELDREDITAAEQADV